MIMNATYSGTPLNWPPLGPVKASLLEGWPHFRGEFVLISMLWDFSKWPEHRGGHISGVLIRGVPLYIGKSLNWHHFCGAHSTHSTIHRAHNIVPFTLQFSFSVRRMFLAAKSLWTNPFLER